MQLAPNVYAASVGGDLIFLDANNDRYCCVTRTFSGPVVALLNGHAPPSAETAELLWELSHAGLIVDGETRGFNPLEVTPPVHDFHTIAAPALPVTASTWLRLAISALEGAFKCKLKPARWLKRRQSDDCDVGVARAATLALQFDQLRPWLPRSGRCLPNSLILMAFLRRHGIRANLVLAVHTFPFEAHCWVEYRGVVLNDTVEHVRWYTPLALA